MTKDINTMNQIELRHERMRLKSDGRFDAIIPIQKRLIALADGKAELASSHNMLSHFYQLTGRLADARKSAVLALNIYNSYSHAQSESLATYHRKLSSILTDIGEYRDALAHARKSLSLFLEFHDPNSDWINRVNADIEDLTNRIDHDSG